MEFARLYTDLSENIGEMPWAEYPRPCLKRNSYFCLNGEWEFAAAESEPYEYSGKVLVPFAPESMLSGVGKVFPESEFRFYRREFSLPEGFIKDRVILHFGAVDCGCEVALNGRRVGEHIGGYEPFCFDITEYLSDNNSLTVKVWDNLSSGLYPYGKQSSKRGGMWYTPVSGIWQTVWLESVPSEYIKSVKIDTDLQRAKLSFEGISTGEVALNGKVYPIESGVCEIAPECPVLWSPENPHLYYYTAVSGKDKVEGYFALRTVGVRVINGIQRLCLNGEPYFFHGVLDQGYWSDGLLLPATTKGYENDIKMLKGLGFNMLRKHIKVEPQLFYYACDKLGITVFQDMVNNSDYSFLRDTILPTVHFLRRNDKRLHKNQISRAAFIEGMESAVKALYNHPSIVEWTIFNEGWGQFCADEMYERLRRLDSSRLIDSASGWFVPRKTDFCSRHVYFRNPRYIKSDKPFFLSEFGGYAYRVKGHSFNPKKAFGYAICRTREDFVKRLCRLYESGVIPLAKKGLCATVYTQLSDVEDEINGLATFDRKVLKVKPEEFSGISEQLKNSIK